MLTYPEFLRNYFDIDTSPLKIDPLDTSYKPLMVSINPKEPMKNHSYMQKTTKTISGISLHTT